MLLDYQELDAMIGRREEWMASECLFTGKVVALDGDTDEVVAELLMALHPKPFLPNCGGTPPATPWLTFVALAPCIKREWSERGHRGHG